MKFTSLFFLVQCLSIVFGQITLPKIWADPAVIEKSGDVVTISFDGFIPSSEDFVAMYSPASTAVHEKGYVGWKNLTNSLKNIQFPLVNNRADAVFRLFIMKGDSHVAYATSNVVKFKNSDEPLQGHLSLTDDPSEMKIMWVTETTGNPMVYYGLHPNQMTNKAAANSSTYTKGDMCASPATSDESFRSPGTIHTALMTGLVPSTTYYYKYGSDANGYATSQFKTGPARMTSETVHMVVYGDLGVDTPFVTHQEEQVPSVKTVKQILRLMESSTEAPTLALHIGDISYARGWAYLWEYFFALIEPISSRIPYMVGIGNHEYDHQGQPFDPNWANYGNDSGGECGVPYQNRFSMPGPQGNLWYSFNYGPVHFLVMSTEHDFLIGSEQYKFLENDLKNVDRNVTPWLIFMGHRPMYSTAAGSWMDGILNHMRTTLEPLIVKYKVDVCFWGHVHAWERTCGVNNFVCAETDEMAPVHVVVGNAGNDYQVPWESPDDHSGNGHAVQPDWSIFRTANYGFGKLAANRSQLELKLIGDQRGDVHDVLVLRKK